MRRVAVLAVVAVALSACGAVPDVGDLADTGDEAFEPGAGVSDSAKATLILNGTTYTWEKNDWTMCDIGGNVPVWVGFQQTEDRPGGDWFSFIDTGDDIINFSAFLDGGEYEGTGGGAADEIRSDGFSYTGDMTSGGEVLDVSLEVTC
ncbi:MAG TPA: hypothetical protein VF115_04720 [Acidimicrobiia bacterium]